MKSVEAHQLRNILQVILGAIETGNVDLARQFIYQAESCIVNCRLGCQTCEMQKKTSEDLASTANPPRQLVALSNRESG